MAGDKTDDTRVIALVGPYSSGKTSLMEAILAATGALNRPEGAGHLVGDGSAEAKAREMGVELNVASTEFLGDRYTFLDCPGSVEFQQEARNAMIGADLAVVVVEPDPAKVPALAPLLRALDRQGIPHALFVNRMDKAAGPVRDLVDAIAAASVKPVVLRHVPIREDHSVTGYVDLASERAYVYRSGKASERVDTPEAVAERVGEARYAMLETLADFDDHLMEELLEDVTPSRDEIYGDLAKDLRDGHIVPIFLGSAKQGAGMIRLMKALRHETPALGQTQERLGVDTGGGAAALVLKTKHAAHAGKMSVVRVLAGTVSEGDTLAGERVGALFQLTGDKIEKAKTAKAGDVVALGRMEQLRTGQTLNGASEDGDSIDVPEPAEPVYARTIEPKSRKDETKLSTALAKLVEEDPSLAMAFRPDTHELVLSGQGEIHLGVAVDRLNSKYGIEVNTRRPRVPYKETIRKGKKQHSRYKKQTGGHGQFGDVVVEIRPLQAGEGFQFDEVIHGGSIPKQYIPSVEAGVREYLVKGPLGFPVVDVGVTLLDGSYHAVDSSDMAFKTAGRMAMAEAMPDCSPALLEPIDRVEIMVPNEHTSKINSVIMSRRGQVLSFDAWEGMAGWDKVEAHIPQEEMQDLIVELRSITYGAGTFIHRFDHLTEVTGKQREQVLKAHQD